MPHPTSGPADPVSASLPVASRFALRMAVLAGFALASSKPFWPVLASLLMVAAALSAILASLRREPVFDRSVLTHWDEAALYAVLGKGAAMLSTTGAAAG